MKKVWALVWWVCLTSWVQPIQAEQATNTKHVAPVNSLLLLRSVSVTPTEGTWVGSTDEAQLVTFDVSGSNVDTFLITFDTSSICGHTSSATLGPAAISNNGSFTMAGAFTDTCNGDNGSVSVVGTFTDDTTSQGTWSYSVDGNNANGTWNASAP